MVPKRIVIAQPVPKPSISHHSYGLFAVACGALFFGLQPISARFFLDLAPHPLTLNAFRCLVEFTFGFVIYLLFEKESVLRLWKQWVTIGFLQAAFFSLHMNALLYASVSTVTVCVFTYPLLAALFLRGAQHARVDRVLFWMAVAFLGVICTVFSSLSVTPTTITGAALGLAAAVVIATYLILMGRITTTSRFGLSASIAGVSCLLSSIVSCFLLEGGFVYPTALGVLYASFTGIFGSVGTFALLWGLSRIATQEAALILNFEIIVTVVGSYLLCGERISFLQLVGIALIFLSIVQGRREQEEEPRSG